MTTNNSGLLTLPQAEYKIPERSLEFMRPVVAYVRVSSDQQADRNNSIPSQIRLAHEYAAKHNMNLIRIYKDEAQSARSIYRDDFLRMYQDAEKIGDFEIVLVWKFSRFARNREDSIIYKRKFEKRGVKVISISEPVDDSPTGKLMEGIIETMDEFYSANLGAETKRGMLENARKGFKNGGRAPYGYSIIEVKNE